MYEIIYLPTARKQLEDIVDSIAAGLAAPDAAFDFIEAVDKAAKSLAEMPYRHPIYHASFAVLEEVRWISVKNYNMECYNIHGFAMILQPVRAAVT